MIFRLLLLLIFLPGQVLSQTNKKMEWKKIEKSDSLKLSRTWKIFLNALEKKDNKTIRKNSLVTIFCDPCQEIDGDYLPSDNLVPIDSFLNRTNKSFLNSPLHIAIKKRGVKFSILKIADFHPRNVPKTEKKDFEVFEIWVQTYVADEWAKGHEGQSHAFRFIKIKHDFKFYGLTSVP